ncbi:MAG: cofactor-independent phosphoglycerate mutase [Chloroflexi bacterium]|nr:cofactor-independent phosphoglycerate mutase [Chloroflexota bacterium]
MKYCVVIMDGASGLPLPGRGGTSLELARTPNLDALAAEGVLGLVRTVPPGMEASSACACMSLLGYDPAVYYRGRGGIEARSMGISVTGEEVVFRCNLVAVRDGLMWSYSSGYISTEEARQLIDAVNLGLGSDEVIFYPGVSYRHICKLRGHLETLEAVCTPPHNISGRPIEGSLPSGPGSEILRDLMARSEDILRDHPVNASRRSRGEIPATTIWLFWGSGPAPDMPSFREVYGLEAAMTSGVDLLGGLGKMAGIAMLEIPGVTDGLDNDYAAQAEGALRALESYDLVVVHIEAPDEAAHDGCVEHKIGAIEKIDSEMVGRLRAWHKDGLRLLVMPDHPTPIVERTHTDDPVPFLLWGAGFSGNGAGRFTEAEAGRSGLVIQRGHDLMGRLVGKG